MRTKNTQNGSKVKSQKSKIEFYSKDDHLVKTPLLGVGLTNFSKEKVLEFVSQSLQNSSKPYYIVTPNPEILVAASKNATLRGALNNAELALIDGVGLMFAGQILGVPLKERIIGTDFMQSLCARVCDWPI